MPRHYLKKWVIEYPRLAEFEVHNPETHIVIPAVRAGICYRVSLVIPAVEPESSKL